MKSSSNTCLFCMAELASPGAFCARCGRSNAQAVNAPHQLAAGSVLAGAYLVGCALGQGGFGITYVGCDLNSGDKVAVKEYYPEGCVTRDLARHTTVLPLAGEKGDFFARGRQRFVDEARALARFNGDPGIVGVRSFFEENGTAYIVMDFVEGQTLKAYIAARGGRLGGQETLRLLAPLVGSLARVHDAGLLHRDISPDNIMLRPSGGVTLLDFGAAREISARGERSNTINVKHGFAPEEQYRTHGEQGPWTDVYALSATIYRAATGVTPPQALDRILSGDPLLPPTRYGADFSPAQEQALLHGLAVMAADRTPHMRQLAAELFAPQPSKDDERGKAYKRLALFGGIGGAAVIAALALVALLATGRLDKREAGAPAASAAASLPTAVLPAAPAETRAPAATPAPVSTQTPAETQAPILSPTPEPAPDETRTVGDFTIRIYGRSCEIAEYLGGQTSVTIPAALDGYPVTGIGYDAFADQTLIEEITLPESILYIADYAFDECNALARIHLPAGLTGIGQFAFSCCYALSALTIPAGTSYIAPAAFDECVSLRLTVAEDNRRYVMDDGVLFSFDRTLLHTYPCGRSGVSYTIPGTVTMIGDSAFDNCDNLSSVIIPDSVTVIGKDAFFSCGGLATLDIPASVTEIGPLAFAYSDVRLHLDGGNRHYRLVDGVLFSADMTLLHSYPHYMNASAYAVPAGVTAILDGAFYDAMPLTSVTLPEGLASIGERAFAFCENLTEIVLPEGVERIGLLGFYGCYAMTRAVIPASVVEIDALAFAQNEELTIYAPAGSAAQAYAVENDIPFRAS